MSARVQGAASFEGGVHGVKVTLLPGPQEGLVDYKTLQSAVEMLLACNYWRQACAGFLCIGFLASVALLTSCQAGFQSG